MKGKMLIGQSGGPTAVINASLAGALREAQRYAGIDAVYGAINGVLGVINEELFDLGREPPSLIDALPQTPAAILGSCRYKLNDGDCERVLDVFRAHNIRFFLYIGGNDSMDTARKIAAEAAQQHYDLAVVGIPKTIDNDLPFTDHSPGYGSAARFTALSVRDAGRDTEAIGNVDHVKIVEIMGRDAGWLVASSALAREDSDDAPHLICVPERRLVVDRFLDSVQRTYERLGHVLVAAAETLRGEDGEPLAQTLSSGVDGFGHPRRSGVADHLCELITERLGLRARFDKAGTIQRSFMAAASAVDVREARLVGEVAVARALAGVSDQMVTLVRVSNDPYECETGLVGLAKVANAARPLPDEFLAADGSDVTEAFVDYARPLIGDPLPRYARLERHRVDRLTERG